MIELKRIEEEARKENRITVRKVLEDCDLIYHVNLICLAATCGSITLVHRI